MWRSPSKLYNDGLRQRVAPLALVAGARRNLSQRLQYPRGVMKYEVIEQSGDWIVQHQGVEVARFPEQELALSDVARRLGAAEIGDSGASLSVRYQARRA
jgi:hypothetical protein